MGNQYSLIIDPSNTQINNYEFLIYSFKAKIKIKNHPHKTGYIIIE